MPSAYEVFFSPQNIVVTLTLIRYTLYMILFPLATFYISYYLVFKQDQSMLGWSGILAVISANLVIAAYVRMAWLEDQEDMRKEGRESRVVKTD